MDEANYSIALISLEIIFSFMVLRSMSKIGANKKMIATIGAIFFVWLTTVYMLISRGFFGSTGMPQLSFSLGVIIPVAFGYLVITSYKPMRKNIDSWSTENYLKLQYWRAVFGIMFFFTAALPAWFQYIGGLGDIYAGIGAFLAVNYLRKNPGKEKPAIILGNLVGIIDFIVVFTLGIFVVLKNQSPDMMFDLIPLYVVPIFILLHIFSLQRIKRVISGS